MSKIGLCGVLDYRHETPVDRRARNAMMTHPDEVSALLESLADEVGKAET